jgi:hypothetical protein
MKLTELASTEPAREEKIGELRFLDLLKTQTRNAHERAKQVPVFKHYKSTSDFLLFDSKVSPKRPKFYLDAFLQALPSWVRYPKRGSSIVGYTSEKLAEERGEGDLFVLIPFDSVKITVANGTSLTSGFKYALNKLQLQKLDNEGLVGWLKSLFDVANKLALDLTFEEPTSFAEFKRELMKLDVLNKRHVKDALELPNAGGDVERFVAFAKRNGSVLDYLNNLLDPEANGFILSSPVSNTLPADREVWLSGKVLAIKRAKYVELFERGAIK